MSIVETIFYYVWIPSQISVCSCWRAHSVGVQEDMRLTFRIIHVVGFETCSDFSVTKLNITEGPEMFLVAQRLTHAPHDNNVLARTKGCVRSLPAGLLLMVRRDTKPHWLAIGFANVICVHPITFGVVFIILNMVLCAIDLDAENNGLVQGSQSCKSC